MRLDLSKQTQPKRMQEDNIKIDLQDVGLENVDWINLTKKLVQWRALVNMVMNLIFLYEIWNSSVMQRL